MGAPRPQPAGGSIGSGPDCGVAEASMQTASAAKPARKRGQGGHEWRRGIEVRSALAREGGWNICRESPLLRRNLLSNFEKGPPCSGWVAMPVISSHQGFACIAPVPRRSRHERRASSALDCRASADLCPYE